MYIRTLVRNRRDLPETLRRLNVPVERTGSSLLITLPRVKRNTFQLVPGCEDGRLRLMASEHGGLADTQGNGTVICAVDGSALVPYDRPRNRRGWTKDCIQAWFSSEEALVEVTATRRNNEPDTIKIVRCNLDLGETTVTIAREVLYTGINGDELPPHLYLTYNDAVRAAHAKARCHHCLCVHYRLR